MINGYADLSPTSKNALNTRLRILHDIIKRKRGTLTADDDESLIVKNAFKDIPVFKDIPTTFKLEVSKLHLMHI